jgi:hypothetical protein
VPAPVPAPVEGLHVDGTRLYVAMGDAGLQVFSLADPANPAGIGLYNPAEAVHAVAAEGDTVFYGTDGGNVVSLNAANPASMLQLDRMGTYGDVVSLSLDGDVLFAGTTEKVYRVAVGDPDEMYQLGRYKYFGFATTSLIGRGGYAYCGTEYGFYLIDFSDVAADPYDAMHFGQDSLAIGGLAMDADGIYLAARDAGFFWLQVPVLRTSGSSRYDTAVELSSANWPAATSVVLATGTPQANAEMIRDVFSGIDHGPRKNAILLNAAGALTIGGKAATMAQGLEIAREIIDSGRAFAKLNELVIRSKEVADEFNNK